MTSQDPELPFHRKQRAVVRNCGFDDGGGREGTANTQQMKSEKYG